MPKGIIAANSNQPRTMFNQTPHSREYLAWLADQEFTGLDPSQLDEAVHVAFGHRVGARHTYEGGHHDE